MSQSFESSRAPEPVGAFPHAKRVGDFIDGSIERSFVRVRWFRESAKFPDKLQR